MAWKGWEKFDPVAHERAVREQGNPDRPKRSKYNATKVNVEGVMFDSKGEAARWRELLMEQTAGLITDLRRQVVFDLTAIARNPQGAQTFGFKKIGEYRADFVYDRGGKTVVEDKKGFRTDMYRWKKRHFEIEYYPMTITEV
jgi:hypothetical protein